MLKIDFENQILALFDVYFWPFNKSHEKINIIFVISAIIASIWNVFIKFRWHDEKTTRAIITRSSFENALICELQILGLQIEEFPILVHKLSVVLTALQYKPQWTMGLKIYKPRLIMARVRYVPT